MVRGLNALRDLQASTIPLSCAFAPRALPAGRNM